MIKQLPVLLLTIFVTYAATSWLKANEVRDLRTALDTLASNEIQRRVQDSLRWETRIAVVTDNLDRALEETALENDSLNTRVRSLVQAVESLEGRVATMVDVNVNLAAALRTDSAAAEVHAAADTMSPPDSITAPYDDGLLSGRIAFFPPSTTFGLEYEARIRGSLVTAELPDGRWSVYAAAEDTARVDLELGRVFVRPPAPVEYCSIPTRGKWGLIGYLLGWATGP